MLVMTAIVGESFRKEPSLSSASATMTSPSPSLALLPIDESFPPMTMVGSSPPWARIVETMEVVVVLPCMPETATENFILRSSASISARGMTGMLRRWASRTSGLSALTAVEVTTTSAVSRLDSRWP